MRRRVPPTANHSPDRGRGACGCGPAHSREELRQPPRRGERARSPPPQRDAAGGCSVAFDDLFAAQQLAGSSQPDERRRAEATFDNALHHAGALIATFDPDSPSLAPLRRALAAYGALRGPEQIAYLCGQGLLRSLDAAQLDSWSERAGAGYVEAFATARGPFSKKGEPRPPWRALSLMERTARARERLLDMPAPPEGSDPLMRAIWRSPAPTNSLKNGVAYLMTSTACAAQIRFRAPGRKKPRWCKLSPRRSPRRGQSP